MKRFTLAALLLALFVPGAFAHDFWIEPSNYRPLVKERVSLDLKVGEHFTGDALERNGARIVRFIALDPQSHAAPIVGIDGRAPAGMWAPKSAGLHWIGYESHPISIELAALKFEQYLAEEGLEHVVRLRQQQGDSARPGREIYSRSVKSLICAVPSADEPVPLTGFDTRLGLPLEIVPETNPLLAAPGDEIAFRVFREGQPLAGALVGLIPRSAPDTEVRLRTDAEGRVKFKITHTGPVLARVCWMVAAPPDSGADWQSTWSSLTFEVRARTPQR